MAVTGHNRFLSRRKKLCMCQCVVILGERSMFGLKFEARTKVHTFLLFSGLDPQGALTGNAPNFAGV